MIQLTASLRDNYKGSIIHKTNIMEKKELQLSKMGIDPVI